MSRIGSQQIKIPTNTEVTQGDNGVVVVKGPKGELTRTLKPQVSVTIEDEIVTLQPNDKSSSTHALWGTYASHIKNMVQGVNEGFEKKLVIEGVGYRAEVQGSDLVLNVGFSHQVRVPIPAELTVTAEKGAISISGIDKELVGQFTARVRGVKPPEPYKGKGIRYDDEIIRRKEGKKSV